MQKRLLSLALALTALLISSALAAPTAPKKLLVVSVTMAFRHESIPTLKKILSQLADQSQAFTVDFVDQPEGEPAKLRLPKPIANPTPDQKADYDAALAKYQAALPAYNEAFATWTVTARTALEKLSPASLKNYDGVIFASTTGELPIPDKPGFLAWIKSGKAFIGIHSATDTFHKWPEYLDMIGGEFDHHGKQLSVTIQNLDPTHPATKSLPASWTITQEEVYQFKNFHPNDVHVLLSLNTRPDVLHPDPGQYPLSWWRNYGDGRVFYTALGHRDDIIDADPNLRGRINSVEISKAYQAHLLGGILWALNLAPSK